MFCYFPPGTIIFSNGICFYFFSNQRVKLIVLNTPRCYLQLHGVDHHQPTSAQHHPAQICCSICHTVQREYNGLGFGSQSESLETFHMKKYFSNQHLNLCLESYPHSKEKYYENESTSPQIQSPYFFPPSFEEFVLCSLLWFLYVGTGSCQMGFIFKFKCFILWQHCPLHRIQCHLLFFLNSNVWHILILFKAQRLETYVRREVYIAITLILRITEA